MRLLVPVALLASSCAALMLVPEGRAAAQAEGKVVSSTPFVRSKGEAAVTELAEALESDFVVPEAGRAYAAALRGKLRDGGYAAYPDAKAFAAAVTADLQAVHKDAHLRMMAPSTGADGVRRPAGIDSDESTITGAGWLAPGVAYIGFNEFFGNDATLAGLHRSLDQVRGARTLIIDARAHRGGGLEASARTASRQALANASAISRRLLAMP